MAYCAVKKIFLRIISKQERQLCLLLQASAAVSCSPIPYSSAGAGLEIWLMDKLGHAWVVVRGCLVVVGDVVGEV